MASIVSLQSRTSTENLQSAEVAIRTIDFLKDFWFWKLWSWLAGFHTDLSINTSICIFVICFFVINPCLPTIERYPLLTKILDTDDFRIPLNNSIPRIKSVRSFLIIWFSTSIMWISITAKNTISVMSTPALNSW